MRYTILLFSALLFMTATFVPVKAQLQPKAGDKQVVLGIQGLSGSSGYIMLRKFKTETICNRYGLNVFYNYSNGSTANTNGTTSDNKYFNNGISVSLGKQKNFNISEKFVPYIALDLGIGEDYSYQYQNYYISDTLLYNKNNSSNFRAIKNDNKYDRTNLVLNVFARPAIGFNYYLGKNFAIGAEYQFTLVNIGYTLTNTTNNHYDRASLEIQNIYDSNSGTTQTVYTLVQSPPVSSTSKNDGGANINGGFSGTVFLTASFYFK